MTIRLAGHLAGLAALACCVSGPLLAAAPRVHTQPAYQSPVRAEPDDLLLIPGYGFSGDDIVVYQALGDTTQLPAPPASVPTVSTATAGFAPIVSAAGMPYSVTVRLPPALKSDQSYVLWVRGNGGWSEGIRVNDARPLWITPAFGYATHVPGGLPRQLKVVGRNLQAAAGVNTQVRLVGPQTITLDAGKSADSVAHYVARVDLPARMQPGEYEVQISRDGVSWVRLADQTFTVRADPGTVAAFRPADFGCKPNDGRDDVACIASAIRAAAAAGGGRVLFDAGTWDMIDTNVADVTLDGIVVPSGVSLIGAGAQTTTVLRHATWGENNARHQQRIPASFTLQGRNTVQQLRFKDERVYRAGDVATAGGILQLGQMFYRASGNDPAVVADVTIAHNVFDRPMLAIGTGGLPIERLVVTGNEFGAFAVGLNLSGHRSDVGRQFRIDDSVIAHNLFKPGSYVDAKIQQGSMASKLGAGRRIDFSDNVADGAASDYLQDPQRDQRGWRAAFFWHMNNNHEMLLVAQNKVTCSGDKAGDGEAIAYDNDANTFALDSARTVLTATDRTVIVSGPLQNQQEGHGVDTSSYYSEHWVRVVDGPGLGQVRKIESYIATPAASEVTFRVSPRWDVVPTRASRIVVAREFWQVYTVDNTVDHRQPPCRKSNLNGPEGGKITLYAEFADSAVEGNRQYDTDGITLHHSYSARDAACATCLPNANFQSFVEVRGNTLEGEYDWMSDCSQSGILVSHSAAPTPSSASPVVGYGLTISHNSITHADGVRGGAITLPITWLKGPPPYDWPLLQGTLIHHNAIQNIDGTVPFPRCDHKQSRRIGINLHQETLATGTVLYANACSATSVPLTNRGRATVLVCPSPVSNSCECGSRPSPPVNVKTTVN